MTKQVPVSGDALADMDREHGVFEVSRDVAYQRLMIVNVVYFGMPGAADREWVLIDAGLMGTAQTIAGGAASRFGEGSRPAAIILTHGHFDHVGALEELAGEWDTPIYAHSLEFPYLNGQHAYPAADPTVGGGIMAALSRFYPRGPIDVGARLRALPEDGAVPHMPGWRWTHTPGHTPGHVSLWNADDRVLIAGDAFITTAQESAYAVATQKMELHGPPMYYTTDWGNARESVQALAALEPEIAVTGHGRAARGEAMLEGLHVLAKDFNDIAVPDRGKYIATVNKPPRRSGRERKKTS